jgi:hypothetical protein
MSSSHRNLEQSELHRLFLAQISSYVRSRGSLEKKPLEADLSPPLPTRIRVYLYNATTPPGGRTPGECKSQLIVPGQSRGERSDFDHSGARIVLLVGYNSDHDVYILWDANLHMNFAYSKNVQIKPETLFEAAAGKVATQVRHLRSAGKKEIVVAVQGQDLAKGIKKRVEITRGQMSNSYYEEFQGD